MKNKYKLGETFPTAIDLHFKGFFIPKGTTSEIIEKIDKDTYKVYFDCKFNREHEECIQVMDIQEIDEIRIPKTFEY